MRRIELRFLIVGLDNAGKTTTLEQLKRIYPSKTPKSSLDRVTPTIGLNLCNVDFDRGTSGVFWDLGGQLMLRGIWEKHYSECDGIIFVIDSADQERLTEVRTTFNKLLHHPVLKHRNIPIILLINKQDDADHAMPISNVLNSLGLPCQTDSPFLIPYSSLNQLAPDQQTQPQRIFKRDSGSPRLVCASACSAIKNVNIKQAVDCLVCEAKIEASKIKGPEIQP